MDSCKITLQILNAVEKLCSVLEEQDDEYFIITVTHENKFLHTGSVRGRRFLESNPDLTHMIGQMFMTHCYGNRNNKEGHTVASTNVMVHTPQQVMSSVQNGDDKCQAAKLFESDSKRTTIDNTEKSVAMIGSKIVTEKNENENLDRISGVGENNALISSELIKKERLDIEYNTELQSQNHPSKSHDADIPVFSSSATTLMVSTTPSCSNPFPDIVYQHNKSSTMLAIYGNQNHQPAVLNAPTKFECTSDVPNTPVKNVGMEPLKQSSKQSRYRSLITGNVVKMANQKDKQSLISLNRDSLEVTHATSSTDLQDFGSTSLEVMQDHGKSYGITDKQKPKTQRHSEKQATGNSHEGIGDKSVFTSVDEKNLVVTVKKELNTEIPECHTLPLENYNTDGKLLTDSPYVEMNKSLSINPNQREGCENVKEKYDNFFSGLAKGLKTEAESPNKNYDVYNIVDFAEAGHYQGFTLTCNEEVPMENIEKIGERAKTSLKSQVKMETAWESEYLLPKDVNDSVHSDRDSKSKERKKGEDENNTTQTSREMRCINRNRSCKKSRETFYTRNTRRSKRYAEKTEPSINTETDEHHRLSWCSSEFSKVTPSGGTTEHQELNSISFDTELKLPTLRNMSVSRDEGDMYLHYSVDKSAEEQYDDNSDDVSGSKQVSLGSKQSETAQNKKKKVFGSRSKTEYLRKSSDKLSRNSPLKRKHSLNRKEEDSDEEDAFLPYLRSGYHAETSLSSTDLVSCESEQSKSINKHNRFSSSDKKPKDKKTNTKQSSSDSRNGSIKNSNSNIDKKPDTSSTSKDKISKVDKKTVAKDSCSFIPKIVAYRSLLTGELTAVDTYSVSKKDKT